MRTGIDSSGLYFVCTVYKDILKVIYVLSSCETKHAISVFGGDVSLRCIVQMVKVPSSLVSCF